MRAGNLPKSAFAQKSRVQALDPAAHNAVSVPLVLPSSPAYAVIDSFNTPDSKRYDGAEQRMAVLYFFDLTAPAATMQQRRRTNKTWTSTN